MQTIQQPILDGNGAVMPANDTGAVLAAGTYFIPLGGADLASVHFEWDGTLDGDITFETSNRANAEAHKTPGWGLESRLGTVSPSGVAATEVVSVIGNEADRTRAVAVIGTQGKLLVLRRGGPR